VRQRDEAQPGQDRLARWQCVHLQITVAAGGGQGGPVGHERAVNTSAAPGGNRPAAPQAGEIAAGRKLDACRADRLLAGERDHHRHRFGRVAQPGQQRLAQPGLTCTEDPLVDVEKLADASLVGHFLQPHPVRQRYLRRCLRRLGDHEQFLIVGYEAGRQQPRGQVSGLIVVVQLPFERLLPGPEELHLIGDDPVGAVRVQPRPGDPRGALVIG
jgi:hypothetical protein